MRISYPSDLPISSQKDKIVQAIKDHQVVVIAGDTGKPYLSSEVDTLATRAFADVVEAVANRLPANSKVSLETISPLGAACGCGPSGCDPDDRPGSRAAPFLG